jgi:hypothetical protein
MVVTLEPLATLVERVTEADGKPATSVAIGTQVFGHFPLQLQDVSIDGEAALSQPAHPSRPATISLSRLLVLARRTEYH